MSTPDKQNNDNADKLFVEVANMEPEDKIEQKVTEDKNTEPEEQKPDEEKKPAGQQKKSDERTLSEVINERATEDESALKGNFRLGNILAGEMLNAAALRKQVKLILLIVFFLILNISNRYGCQQRLIKIDKLQKDLQDMKFRQLSNASRLTQECRQSNVLEKLKQSNTTLQNSNQPPYFVNIPTE